MVRDVFLDADRAYAVICIYVVAFGAHWCYHVWNIKITVCFNCMGTVFLGIGSDALNLNIPWSEYWVLKINHQPKIVLKVSPKQLTMSLQENNKHQCRASPGSKLTLGCQSVIPQGTNIGPPGPTDFQPPY